MKQPVVHLAYDEDRLVTWCSVIAEGSPISVTNDIALVTCRNCRRRFAHSR